MAVIIDLFYQDEKILVEVTVTTKGVALLFTAMDTIVVDVTDELLNTFQYTKALSTVKIGSNTNSFEFEILDTESALLKPGDIWATAKLTFDHSRFSGGKAHSVFSAKLFTIQDDRKKDS